MGSSICYRHVVVTQGSLAVYSAPCTWNSPLTTLTTCQRVQFLGEKRPSDCFENSCYAKVRCKGGDGPCGWVADRTR